MKSALNLKFEWCFELHQIVESNRIMQGMNRNDKFEIIDRNYERYGAQWFKIRRLSDGEVWDDIIDSDLSEAF